ncbi:MAG: right-handed parallel beta-helix repeat-containing protein [Armatimonadota bacterium]
MTSLLLSSLVNAGECFVAPDGHDDGPGTKAQPFASLERARDAIREIKRAGKMPAEGVTVWLHGGKYVRTTGFTLTAEDAGTAQAPISYRAYPGEVVHLIGGKEISGFVPVTDPTVLARLQSEAKAHVLQVDLKAQGITDLGKLVSRGFGRPSQPAHLELFFQDQPMTLARWPNNDFVQIAAIPDTGKHDDGHGQTEGKLEDGFYYEGDRPKQWQAADDIWIHGYWSWDWANSYERIDTLDTTTRLIKTRAPFGLYGFRAKQRYYFLNILEELDAPGEYYMDAKSGILYFWPPAPLEQGRAVVSVLETPLISLQDAAYVTISGLTLECTRGDGIRITGGTQNTVERCVVRNTGDWGIIVNGGTRHTVSGCDLYNLGDGGVRLAGGDRKTLTPGGHLAENNEIHHMGRWSRCYQPGIAIDGVGNRLAHNLIHDGPHCGIMLSGNEHQIEYNEVHHVALETGDVGAFYMGRDYTMRGNTLRYNYFHHLGGVGMGSMAFYFDDCSSGNTVYGNIFYKTKWAMFIGGGRDFRVENNVFVDCHPAVHVDGRGLDHSPVWHDMVYKTMKKRLEEMNPHQPPYRERYPILAELDPFYAKNDGVPPGNILVAHNICSGGVWLEVGWHATEAMLQLQDNLVGDDPGFVDKTKGNFQLREDSPAFKMGFTRIPVEEIGLQRK